MNKEKYVLKILKRYKNKDFTFSSGRILGSMCTSPLPIAKKAYMQFIETNLGDPALFPGSKKIENMYLSFVSKLLNAPDSAAGAITSGGSESNLIAILIAKSISKKREIILPSNYHFSFEKIASFMDLKLKPISLTKEYVVNVSELARKISKDTLAVVAVAGSTELGTIDPIPEISDICYDENVFLHIDAAFGGYIIPFLKDLNYNVPDFDFKLNGTSSISIDAHKMGCSVIPMGTILVKNKDYLNKIGVRPYCVSGKLHYSILGTRSAAPVAAAYAVNRYLGRKGYRNIVKRCMDNTFYLEEKLREKGFNVILKPVMNIIGIRFKKPEKVVKKLSDKGWKVNLMNRMSSIRIVVMPHVTRKTIDEFIPTLEEVCKEAGEI